MKNELGFYDGDLVMKLEIVDEIKILIQVDKVRVSHPNE